MAVVTSTFPEQTKELLAYLTLIVHEANAADEEAGWLMVLIPASRWWGISRQIGKLNQSLYAGTYVAQGEQEIYELHSVSRK